MPDSSHGKAPSFQGPFLFVNHDAANLKAAPHQRAIFTHVQSRYKKWQKNKDAQLLPGSAQVPKLSASKPSLKTHKNKEDPVSGTCLVSN